MADVTDKCNQSPVGMLFTQGKKIMNKVFFKQGNI